MTSSSKIIVLVGLLLFIGLAAATQFIPVHEEELHFSDHTINAGELIQGLLVGQTFVTREDNLSAVAVKFATYSNRKNEQPVEFHLRRSIDDREDIRVATVDPRVLGDNQLHRFEFEPIADSANQTWFFYLVSPKGRAGDAVTVDLDARDPYPEGSAYIMRGPPVLTVDRNALARSGKQTVDVVFATYHETSLRAATINELKTWGRTLVATWDERNAGYLLWLELFAPVLAFSLLLVGLRGDGETHRVLSSKVVSSLLVCLVVGGVLFRLLYATAMPITNDEGNYLYDAQALLHGTLAGGDGYVKAPLVIVWLAVWQWLLGNTILAGRLAMVVASSLITIPVYFIGKAAFNQRTGLLAAAAWAFMGAPAVFGVYIHTQSVALLFGVAGIALLWTGLKQEEPTARWFVAAGLLLGLGVASRKSILALGLVPLGLILVESMNWRDRISRLLRVGVVFGLVIAAFVALAVTLYGCDDPLFLMRDRGRCMGAEEALGINSAEDGLAAVTLEEADNVREYSLRGMTPFFRESLPLILLSLLGWGVLLETTARRSLNYVWFLPTNERLLWVVDHVIPKIMWLMPAAVLWWAWSFYREYEGTVFHELGGMWWLWYVMAGSVVAGALWPRSGAESLRRRMAAASPAPTNSQPSNVVGQGQKISQAVEAPVEGTPEMRSLLVGSLLPLLWIGGLVIFYLNWIKFHANYLVEFLPPLAIMSGVGAYLSWYRLRGRSAFEDSHPAWSAGQRVLAGCFMVGLLWAMYLSNYVTYVYEHTGTFDQSAVEEAAVWAQQNIPKTSTIFTGAAVVPYLSGHRVALDIAHPRWYAYEFTRKDTERLNTFLPSAEKMLAAYREADWLLLEQQTAFSFLMEYSEIEEGLERDWELVHEVENLSNPLKFYRRIR